MKSEGRTNLITTTGRRKTAVARVFMSESKSGKFTVNEKDIAEFFTTEKDRLHWKRPFHLVGVSHPDAQFEVSIRVFGSGFSSQKQAIVHGISRALAKLNEEYRKILRKEGLLTRDPRMVERKKYYLRKARKSPQYSKR